MKNNIIEKLGPSEVYLECMVAIRCALSSLIPQIRYNLNEKANKAVSKLQAQLVCWAGNPLRFSLTAA